MPLGSTISNVALLLRPNDDQYPVDPISPLPLDDFVLDNLPPSPIFPNDPIHLGSLLSDDYLATYTVHETVQLLVGPDQFPDRGLGDYFVFG
jgi:hypothetical protein